MSQSTVQSCKVTIWKEYTYTIQFLKSNDIRNLLLLTRPQSEPRMPFRVSPFLATKFQKVQVTYVHMSVISCLFIKANPFRTNLVSLYVHTNVAAFLGITADRRAAAAWMLPCVIRGDSPCHTISPWLTFWPGITTLVPRRKGTTEPSFLLFKAGQISPCARERRQQ